MLYSVENLLSKDNSLSIMVLTVVQMDITEIHSRINVAWPTLQNILDKTVDFAFSS